MSAEMTLLGAALPKLESGDPGARAEVMAELDRIARDKPYNTMTLTQLTELHIRLCDIAGKLDTSQLRVEVSGQAWRIGNVASPYYNDADSIKRRDR